MPSSDIDPLVDNNAGAMQNIGRFLIRAEPRHLIIELCIESLSPDRIYKCFVLIVC